MYEKNRRDNSIVSPQRANAELELERVLTKAIVRYDHRIADQT